MTGPADDPHKPQRAEEEALPIRKIVLVGTVTLVIFAISVYLADQLRARRDAAIPGEPAPIPPGVEQMEVGIVDQELFELDDRAPRDRQAQHKRLESYGWVDRDAGVIHIPIQRAMERMVEEQQR
jgi:hypothetical protein